MLSACVATHFSKGMTTIAVKRAIRRNAFADYYSPPLTDVVIQLLCHMVWHTPF
jgi:hypothetical protein